MSTKLVIVESPAKAKTLKTFLGAAYTVKASMGHVRDLPKSSLGIDVNDNFTPHYVIPKEKKAVVTEIKKAAKGARDIFLATDPDREGEAIAWHLVEAANLDGKLQRVVFHEITREAVKEAFEHPRGIDTNLVDAQQARRILDRIVGYKISPLLWRTIAKGLSAGRVQTAALRMLVEREREVRGFVPQEYWLIQVELARLTPGAQVTGFRASLVGLSGDGKLEIPNKAEADRVVADLERAAYTVIKATRKDTFRQPAPPFITSTMQQEAWRQMRFSAEHTMSIAQQLYEGLPVGEGGQVGLITYMRTDSPHVAASAVTEAREFIEQKYGGNYLSPTRRAFASKSKLAQEAHEAIRPTSVRREPEAIKQYLSRDQFRLYELVWKRMVASQMAAAVLDSISVDIEARPADKSKPYLLRAASSSVKFPGFTVLYSEGKDDAEEEEGAQPALAGLTRDDLLKCLGVYPEQRFTQPLPRYTEATLIKALEQNGIGRPSTYAPIISTVQKRGYAVKKQGRFYAEELGILVSDLLVKHFPRIFDLGFTALMEEKLDEIARGEQAWIPAFKTFYTPFSETIKEAVLKVEKVAAEVSNEVCPTCGKPMLIKVGRYGKFLACSGYPECKTTRPLEKEKEEVTDEVCPNCGKPMVIKRGRFGKFLSCSGYPECKTTKPLKSARLNVRCPLCGGDIVERRNKKGKVFYGCSKYPECKFISPRRPLDQPCPKCGSVLVSAGRKVARCLKCDYKGPMPEKEAEPALTK